MPLFRPSPYIAIVAAYEKLLLTERAHHVDAEERWNKERAGLLQQLMVLTNPQAVRTANSTIRQVGVIRDAPLDFTASRELPEDFDEPSMPFVRRPPNVAAAVGAISRADVERARVIAEKRREAQDEARLELTPPAEVKPS